MSDQSVSTLMDAYEGRRWLGVIRDMAETNGQPGLQPSEVDAFVDLVNSYGSDEIADGAYIKANEVRGAYLAYVSEKIEGNIERLSQEQGPGHLEQSGKGKFYIPVGPEVEFGAKSGEYVQMLNAIYAEEMDPDTKMLFTHQASEPGAVEPHNDWVSVWTFKDILVGN